MVQVISMKSDLARVATLALAFTGMAYTASAQGSESSANDSILNVYMNSTCDKGFFLQLPIAISLFSSVEQTDCNGTCRPSVFPMQYVNITDPEVKCYFWSYPKTTCGPPGSNDGFATGAASASNCTTFATNMTSFQCFKGMC